MNEQARANIIGHLKKKSLTLIAFDAEGDPLTENQPSYSDLQNRVKRLREAIEHALLVSPDSGAFVTIEDSRNAAWANFELRHALRETES